MKSLALVVPCKNEASRLDVETFREATERYQYLSLIFVDDGSTDDTAEKLALLERQSPSIRALYLPKNVGKAEAVRTGVCWALDHTCCDAVGFWDADLATPLSELPAFTAALDDGFDCDVALGSRWPHLGARIDRRVFRNCTGWLMKRLIRSVLRVPVYDTQCGAKVFRRAVAERVFARRFLSRWLFDVEILKRLSSCDLRERTREIPLGVWNDVAGSKLGVLDSLRLLPDLVCIGLHYSRTIML